MTHDRKWDEAYSTGSYRQQWGISYPSQELVSFIATNLFSKHSVVLDIGCGAGQETIFLAKQGFRVIGVDLSPEGLKIAKENAMNAGVDVDFHLASATDLPIDDHSIDMVNDRGCFHVIPNSQRSAYAQSLARVLKPGGTIFLRGCRNIEDDHFNAVTPSVIQKYFDHDFSWNTILPIQLSNGHSFEGLDANLVILTRKQIR